MFFVLLTLVLFISPVFLSTNSQSEPTVKILLRESPNQYYTSQYYTTIKAEIESNGGVFDVYSSENTSSFADFINYDLILIPNPGSGFSAEELQALKSFIDNGGALLIMGDVQFGGNKYGKPDWLNELLDYIGAGTKVHFWGTNDKGCEIKDDTNNVARPWQVRISGNEFLPHEIGVGISDVVVTSTALEVYDPNVVVATSPETSYLTDVNDKIVSRGKIPWLVAVTVGGGKVVVSGSTRAFSDRSLIGVGTTYIKYGDNLRLFYNILAWTTGYKIKLKPVIDVFIPILDIFGIILGIIVVHYFGWNTRTIGLYAVWGALMYAIIAALQVAIFGVTVVGVALPQWGYVSGGILSTGPEEMSIPAWGVAFMRYFLAGFFEVALGAFIYHLYVKIVVKE